MKLSSTRSVGPLGADEVKIAPGIKLDESEIEFTFIRASGPGGQNVNKVASAVQLRFDVKHSPSLPEDIRARIQAKIANKMTIKGEIIIKANRYRTQERNKQDALERLQELLRHAVMLPKKRKKTRPTFASTQKRLAKKKLHAKVKALRRNKSNNDY